jgi:hypothetical protein
MTGKRCRSRLLRRSTRAAGSTQADVVGGTRQRFGDEGKAAGFRIPAALLSLSRHAACSSIDQGGGKRYFGGYAQWRSHVALSELFTPLKSGEQRKK